MRTLILLAMGCAALQAADAEVMSWARSPEALLGEFVTVQLRTGNRVGGYWTAVTATEFTMKVRETSNKRAVPKGPQTIYRSEIVKVRAGIRRTRGRISGITVGYLIGMPIGFSLSYWESAAPLAIPAATTAAGYYLGKAFDQRTREIVFVD